MKLEEIEIGKKYRINYKFTKTRAILWEHGLLPAPGTVIIVTNIRENAYTQPISIVDFWGNPYHCCSSDLIPHKKAG